jgi:hypothetical protein|eukprot:COSAG01_NODE_6413_length_3678_cov_3.825650_2_plen_80_part_00
MQPTNKAREMHYYLGDILDSCHVPMVCRGLWNHFGPGDWSGSIDTKDPLANFWLESCTVDSGASHDDWIGLEHVCAKMA